MKFSDDSHIGRFFDSVTTPHRRGGGAYYYKMLELCRARLLLVWIVMGVVFFALAVRIGTLPFFSDVIAHEALQSPKKLRGDILDRFGNLLASSAIIKSLNAEVPLMRRANVDFEHTAQRLHDVFPDLDEADLLDKFQRLPHFPIRSRLTPEQAWQVRQLGIPGIYTLRSEGRIYPFGDMTAHLVGFVSQDNVGQGGVELRFNSFLSKGGEPLRLSADIRIQHILVDVLRRVFNEQGAKSACGIVMDVHSSEVLAMASFPTFNPHDVAHITPERYFNCVTQSSYELGSTFKLVTAAMGLENGTASMDTLYDTTRPIRQDGWVISDLYLSDKPYSFRDVIVRSSNIGAALIARDVGGERQKEFLRQLGLLQPSEIELEGKSKPIITEQHDELSTMTIAFGHGIAVSPMHLASAVSAIINDGVFRKPTLLHLPELQPELAPGLRVVSEDVSRALRQLMYLVVKEGSGRGSRVAGYVVGGKTGTAEKLVETSAGLQYSADFVISSFLAAFPIHQPQYIIYVVVDEPKGKNDNSAHVGASRVAVPAVKEIIERIIPVAGVAKFNENAFEVQENLGFGREK